MSRADDPYDNAFMESCFSRFKTELLGDGAFDNLSDAQTEIFEYTRITTRNEGTRPSVISAPMTLKRTIIFTPPKQLNCPLKATHLKYPDNAFTVVVFKDEAAKFSYKLLTLEGKNIWVSGKEKDYKGKPEIVVSEEGKIQVK